ncbi:hypothetical protein VP01_2889g1 [Puccinia sorghi]|uniref:Uncharacterized protein n=1 Tax=Puccinia sorghi TaxID=27349 RepID=A0A0L6V2D1_9BASI|nr:hypothetical protein VP01_2889g1 [Puccinia sorghi]
MRPMSTNFLDEELRSDEFLFTQKFQHNVKISFIYPSSLPGFFTELCKGFLHPMVLKEDEGGGCGKFSARLLSLCGIPLPLGIQSNSHLGIKIQVHQDFSKGRLD